MYSDRYMSEERRAQSVQHLRNLCPGILPFHSESDENGAKSKTHPGSSSPADNMTESLQLRSQVSEAARHSGANMMVLSP